MLVQRSAVLVEGVDFLAELRLAFLGQRHVAGDRVELGLPLGPRCRGGRLVRRRVPGGRGRNRHHAGKGGSSRQWQVLLADGFAKSLSHDAWARWLGVQPRCPSLRDCSTKLPARPVKADCGRSATGKGKGIGGW